MKKIIITYVVLLISFIAIAQKEKISIKGGNMDFDEVVAPGATILNGNVIFTHSGATLTCDKAFYYQKENFLKAFGNVKLNQGDTIHLTSKYLEYDGNTKLAMANGDVVVSDKKMTLETTKAFFDRQKQTAYYNQKGTIHSDDNVLVSDSGIYFMDESRYEFVENVQLTNPKYTIDSKKLDYFTNTGEVFLYENTVIKSKENTIYCNKGFYDTKNDLSYFTHNAHIVSKEREMYGDSITYDRKRAFATAHQNIVVLDTTNHTTIRGHYAEMFEKKDSVFITKRAEIIRKLSEKDSMHIHGDTIMATGKKDFRKVRIFKHVKMYSKDMQAKCDSIFMDERTGITKLLNDPILWAQKNQIVGDTILLLTDEKHQKMDSIKAIDNVFITQKDTIAGFNQIKGRLLKGKILDNELRIVDVEGNAESIYYIRDEKLALIGIDKKMCSRINFELENQAISTITYFKSVSANTYPEDKFPEKESKLKGFAWREDERPDSVEAIFKNNAIKVTEKPLELHKKTNDN